MSAHRNPNALLTPLMHRLLEQMLRLRRIPMHALTPQQARLSYEFGANALESPAHKLERVQDLTLPVRDGTTIAARLYAPSMAALPVLVYFHGGGMTVGSLNTHDTLCRSLSHLAHCAVLAVDYRLAPEHQFPVAAHDAWDAVQWLAGQGAALGLDCTRLAVGGDSAGGTLAAVCAIEARNAALPLALQLLIYPSCSDVQDLPSRKMFAKGFLLDEELIQYFLTNYVNDERVRHDWRFAPSNAEDLQGVAPAWIGLAECDPLVDGGVQYADQLRLAGVPVDLEIYRGVIHEFIKFGRLLPEARQAQMDAARALRHAFQLPPLTQAPA